jgi:hypothetical protein
MDQKIVPANYYQFRSRNLPGKDTVFKMAFYVAFSKLGTRSSKLLSIPFQESPR